MNEKSCLRVPQDVTSIDFHNWMKNEVKSIVEQEVSAYIAKRQIWTGLREYLVDVGISEAGERITTRVNQGKPVPEERYLRTCIANAINTAARESSLVGPCRKTQDNHLKKGKIPPSYFVNTLWDDSRLVPSKVGDHEGPGDDAKANRSHIVRVTTESAFSATGASNLLYSIEDCCQTEFERAVIRLRAEQYSVEDCAEELATSVEAVEVALEDVEERFNQQYHRRSSHVNASKASKPDFAVSLSQSVSA